jgi:hypothetical protein
MNDEGIHMMKRINEHNTDPEGSEREIVVVGMFRLRGRCGL